MLSKLLKYDLKSVYKVLIVFYVLDILVATIAQVFSHIADSFIASFIAEFMGGATIGIAVSIIINCLMRGWVRFKNNLYGDESYLSHTLPVSKGTHYLSKFLTILITSFTSILVIGISISIAYYSKDNVLLLKNIVANGASLFNISSTALIASLILVLFLELVHVVQLGYTGIILGYRSNSEKVGKSIVWGIALYFGTQVLIILFLVILGLFNPGIKNLFFTTTTVEPNALKTLMIFAVLIYIALVGFYYALNVKVFKRGVNVE